MTKDDILDTPRANGADGSPVTQLKMAILDHHVPGARRGIAVQRLDGYAVVTVVNEGVVNSDVLCSVHGVDSVGVVRFFQLSRVRIGVPRRGDVHTGYLSTLYTVENDIPRR